jgi:hypothetical protein
MQLKKGFLWVAGGLLSVVAIGSLWNPKPAAAQNLKQTVVELLFPSRPFQGQLVEPDVNPRFTAIGPAQGTLGVTSLIVSNTAGIPQIVEIFQATMSPDSHDCSGTVTNTTLPDRIFMRMRLEANQTISLPFPSPWVFTPINGLSCIAMGSTDPATVEVYVTGFVN